MAEAQVPRPQRSWSPEDELGYAHVARWPYLRREVREFWAKLSAYERTNGHPAEGTLEHLADILGSNKTSVRDTALRLEDEGLLVGPIQLGNGNWRLQRHIPIAGEVPSAAEVRSRRGLVHPKRLRATAHRAARPRCPSIQARRPSVW